MSTAPAFRKRSRKERSSEEEAYAGPSLPDVNTLTPPTSPVVKRVRREVSATQGEIHDTGFRCGGPVLCRLPFVTDQVDPESLVALTWKNLEEQVVLILESHGIKFQVLALQGRRWRYDKEASAEETATVVVCAEKDDKDWVSVCIEIRKLFVSHDLPLLNIELLDERGVRETRSQIVEPTHPIVDYWAKLEPEVEKILGHMDWVMVALLRHGTSDERVENPITISITISELSTENWVDVREQIVELLDRQHLSYVAVEILRGEIDYSVGDPYILDKGSWETAAKLGRSIGCRGYDKSSGTLGRFLDLKSRTGEWKTYGLTCFHCVLPDKMAVSGRETWEQHGLRPGDTTNMLEIEQPSSGDHLQTMRDITDQVDQIQTSDFMSIKEKLEDPNEFVPPYQERGHRTRAAAVLEFQQRQAQARQFFEMPWL
ncbi:hypothetical protein MMC13_001393 [Lambiella insularis]|nr:hypothetical protein [Lambiella insularis]